MTTTYTQFFERKTRDSGEAFYALTDDAPEWLRVAVYNAHDDELPNDWRFETCHAILSNFEDGSTDPDEVADSLTDVYNHDLARWLADDVTRGCIELEGFQPDTLDVWTLARAMQYETIYNMVGVLAAAIEDNEGEVDE